ncbi:MAG: efflux RND transporter permease subunit, partial [Steroidobacteraceae bacterium]
QLAAGIRKRVDELGSLLPAGTRLSVVYDQSRFISSAIAEVREAALLGGLLAILVLYLFLRDARATLVTGIAIPVSVIGTFLLMYLSDLSLNIMSLGGIALAVGMLVDNAVVVLESIVRRHEQGLPRTEAARVGTQEVASAVTAATLTSVAGFFPMVFISGVAGQLFRDQALTVTYALLFSLAVALTLVPMLAAGAPPRPAAEPGRLGRVSGALATLGGLRRRLASGIARTMRWLLTPAAALTQGVLARVEAAYGPLLGSALDHRGRVMGIAVLTLAASLALVPRLGSELIPQMSQGEFLLDVRLAPGATLEQTDAVVEKAEALAQAQSGVAQSYAVSGTGNRLDADPTDAGENTGRLTVTLQPGASRGDEERAIGELRQGLQDVPGAQFRYSRPALFSFDTPLEVEVIGYDLQALQQAAERVQLAMAASPLFSDVKSSVESGNPEVQILFDQDRATRLGLEVRGVADRVVSSIRGDVATRYKLRDRNIDVLVRGVDTRASSVEEIRNLVINPGSDQPVPLSAVADIRIATGPAEIRRARQERVAIVSANLAEGDLGGALVELDRIVQSISPAPGIDLQVGGQSEEMQGSFRSLEFTLIMAVFLVYLVMASQFESLLHPFVILLTIPLALVGSIWAMFLTGTTLNVVAYIGVIMLAGIVVNQSIVLIDAVNQARERGLDKREAILEAGRLRLRPILITKLTTVLGLLPMALGLGEGAEVRQPMAITVIGGVAISGLFTLLVIPVAYSLLDRKEFAPGVRP